MCPHIPHHTTAKRKQPTRRFSYPSRHTAYLQPEYLAKKQHWKLVRTQLQHLLNKERDYLMFGVVTVSGHQGAQTLGAPHEGGYASTHGTVWASNMFNAGFSSHRTQLEFSLSSLGLAAFIHFSLLDRLCAH